MNLPHIVASTSSASRPSVPEAGHAHTLLLAGSGVLLAGFHQAFDLSLGLPGHFGVILMAVLVMARAGSPLPTAAMVTTLGYLAGTAVFAGLGGHKLLNLPAYLLCAAALDAAFRLSPALVRSPVPAALVGAGAFALKPLLVALLAAGFAFEVGALRHGAVVPLFSHAAFGGVGAAIGALLWAGARGR